MRYIKYTIIGLALLVAGMYGWYLMATEINRHADFAATIIIEDTFSANAAYDLELLREAELALRENNIDSASKTIQKLIDNKTWQLKACVTEQCEVLGKHRHK